MMVPYDVPLCRTGGAATRFGRIALLLACVGTTACDPWGTGPSEATTGTYTLRSVGGASVPGILWQLEDRRFELTGGAITLHPDQTFDVEVGLRNTVGAAATSDTYRRRGTFERKRNELHLAYEEGARDTGSVFGAIVTVSFDEVTFLFRR